MIALTPTERARLFSRGLMALRLDDYPDITPAHGAQNQLPPEKGSMKRLLEKAKRIDLGWLLLWMVLFIGVFLAGYQEGKSQARSTTKPAFAEAPEVPVLSPAHVHRWGKWGEPTPPGWSSSRQTRQCLDCGWAEQRWMPEPSK